MNMNIMCIMACVMYMVIIINIVPESKDALDYDNVVDIQKDAAERRRQIAIEDEKAEREDVATDENFEQADTFRVLKDRDGDAYDILMTHVDTQSGPYGANMFYKMQVLHNPITGTSHINTHQHNNYIVLSVYHMHNMYDMYQ